MKKTLYLYLIGCLALLPAAEASTVLMDLSPVGFRNYRFERERDHSRGCMGV